MSALGTYRILELAEGVSGEYCGKLLADFGAEVIKIERPGRGSPTRRLGPFGGDGPQHERSGLFAYLNTNKHSVEIDLGSDVGASALATLLDQVDVVIDDHQSGWLKSVGLDPDSCQARWPGLVLCSITDYGQNPPEDRRHAEDLTVFHSSGWGYHTPGGGYDDLPPLKGPGRFQVSYEAGMDAAMCIVAALFEREESRLGRFIDVSRHEVMASRSDYVLAQLVGGDMDVSTSRGVYDLHGPAGIFPCRDGYIYVWMATPNEWAAYKQLVGNPEWARDLPNDWLMMGLTPERIANCRRDLCEWLKTKGKDEAAVEAQKLGLALVPLNNTEDLIASPQFQYRKYFVEVAHPVLGTTRYPTVPYRLSETPARITSPAPLLGQHTGEQLPVLQRGGRPGIERPKAVVKRDRGGPLKGVRVVELGKVWAGPETGKQLAFLGAEVVKIESLGSLDVTRMFGDMSEGALNKAPGFKTVNPQKLSVRLDLKARKGVELVLDLLRHTDILLENLRPGAMERSGLGFEAIKAINPGIVYISMGMYGNEGPLAYQTGYAPCFNAVGGLSALVGYEGRPPTGINIRYGDSTYGTAAAFGGLVALLHSRRTGVGQHVDVSAVECMTGMVADSVMDYMLNGVVHGCVGNRHPEMAPHGAYPCLDGDWISIAVSSEESWCALAGVAVGTGLASDPRFRTLADRKANEVELDRIISEWTANRHAGELASALQSCGVAAAKSQNSIDMVSDQSMWGRGFYPEVTEPDGNTRHIVGTPWRMTRGAALVDGAPWMGQHTTYVLGEILGLSPAEQRQLADEGITR